MVNVANKDYEDKAYISFGEGYGLEKIGHQNEDIPMIYFPVNDVNYAIAILDSDIKEVPLSFEAKTMGEYTITIKSDANMFENVYLVDNMTGSKTNMLTDDYSFIATSNDIPNRFVITLSEGASIDEYSEKNDIFAYVNDGALIINNISKNTLIDIYDVMGRKLFCDVATGESCVVEVGNVLSAGLYIVKVSGKEGVRTQKVIL